MYVYEETKEYAPIVKPYAKIVKEPITVSRRRWNVDVRGGLTEILRADDPEFMDGFGQVYCTTINPNLVKAWHLHYQQTDRFIVLRGTVRFVGVRMPQEDSYETVLDFIVDARDPYLITVPPLTWHGFQNMSAFDEALVINVPNRMYNRETPDEQRLPYNHTGINFPWKVDINY